MEDGGLRPSIGERPSPGFSVRDRGGPKVFDSPRTTAVLSCALDPVVDVSFGGGADPVEGRPLSASIRVDQCPVVSRPRRLRDAIDTGRAERENREDPSWRSHSGGTYYGSCRIPAEAG
jgi:hypothetical protein